jgi:succinoglycan biosynthesis transport protein ExoP
MDDPVISEGAEGTPFAVRFFNNLHRYKSLLLKYWWILLLTVGAALAVQEYFLRHVTQSYTSTGRMTVNVRLAIPNANLYNEQLDSFFGTQIALMQSDSVLNRVRTRLAAANPPYNWVPVSISVSVPAKTSIFNLSAEGSDARYTQAYLQAVMEEYITLKKDLLNNASLTTKASLENELQTVEGQLATNKEDIFEYQSNNSVVFLQNGGNSAADHLAYLTLQLADKKSELQMLQTLTLDENLQREQHIFAPPQGPQTAANGQPNAEPQANGTPQNPGPGTVPNPANGQAQNNAQAIPTSLGDFEASYLQAKQQILQLTAQRDEMGKYLRPKHPDMIAINDEISKQEKLLEIYKGQSQDQLTRQQHILTLQISDTESNINDWQAKAIDASQKLAIYQGLLQTQTHLQNTYDQLRSTLQTIEADSGISQDSVSIFEPATPAVPSPVEAGKHLAMAGVIGLILGLGILLFIDRLDDRPASFSEMRKLFEEAILGQIPLMKAKNKKVGVQVIQQEDDRHTLVEAFRNLRSAVVFKESFEKHQRSIVITSAIPKDGKSMTAANLAVTLAQAGERVLLVDADLRRGVMHKHFSLPVSPGLAEVLSDQCKWTEAVVQSSIPNLYVMPCGKSQRNPGTLFLTRIQKFIKEIATGQYDYYLFDTAPIMATDDVSALAPHVDGVIMVVRAGFTPGRVAQASLDLLYLRRIKVMGLVFNAVRPSASEYYYYRYTEYYSDKPAA